MIVNGHDLGDCLPLTRAVREFFPLSRTGKPFALPTIWRWCQQGVRGGKKLQTFVFGGQRFVSRAAVEEFFRELNPELGRCVKRTLPQRQRSSERAAKQLEAAGI